MWSMLVKSCMTKYYLGLCFLAFAIVKFYQLILLTFAASDELS